MSIDTSHARPTSPGSTLSPWQALLPALAAERATRAAVAAEQARADIAEHAARSRTVADVEDDIRRYKLQLKAPAVIHCLPVLVNVQAKLDAAQAELATMHAGGAL